MVTLIKFPEYEKVTRESLGLGEKDSPVFATIVVDAIEVDGSPYVSAAPPPAPDSCEDQNNAE